MPRIGEETVTRNAASGKAAYLKVFLLSVLVFGVYLLAIQLKNGGLPGPPAKDPVYPSLVDIAVTAGGTIYVLDEAPDLRLLDNEAKTRRVRLLYSVSEKLPPHDYIRVRPTDRDGVPDLIGNQSIELKGSLRLNVSQGQTNEVKLGDSYPFPGHSFPRSHLVFPNKDKNRVEEYGLGTGGHHSKCCYPGDRELLADPALSFGYCAATCLVDGNADGPGRLDAPYRVDVAGSTVWVLDASETYKVFDLSGKHLRTVEPRKQGEFSGIIDVESDSEGNVYLACAETDAVLTFDREGKLAQVLRLQEKPTAFGLGPDGNFYVGVDIPLGESRTKPVIRVLTQSGDLLKSIQIYPEGKPMLAREVRQRAEDDAREAVFRYAFRHKDPVLEQGVCVYFLSMDDYAYVDPDEEFMKRFVRHKPPVKKVSECERTEPMGIVKDRQTGSTGMRFWLERVWWLSDNELEIGGGYHFSGMCGSVNTYTLKYRFGRWIVVKDKQRGVW